MDNYIIGLLPTTTPTDEMKIAVGNTDGRYAVTVGDLKKYFSSNNDDNTKPKDRVFDFKCTVTSTGDVYQNKIPDVTVDELRKGLQIDVTTEFRDPIKWTSFVEGLNLSVGNTGYNVFMTLDKDGGTYPSGSELTVYSETNGVKDTFNFKIKG